MRLSVKVVPGASRDRVIGWLGERLKVSVAAPPERGKANQAVLDLLGRTLGLPRSAVRIVRGESRPEKVVEVDAPEAIVLDRLPRRQDVDLA